MKVTGIYLLAAITIVAVFSLLNPGVSTAKFIGLPEHPAKPPFLLNVVQNQFSSDMPEEPGKEISRPAGSPIAADDTHFVADTGGELDQYLFRDHDADGKLRFSIPITRYYFLPGDSNIQFDSNGFLKTNNPNSLQYVLDKKLLPTKVRLELKVWDVDEDSTWCPEVDLININGIALIKNNAHAKLTGANQTWSVVKYDVPISMLKFPQQKGNSGPPTPANNEIAIQIDANRCTSSGGYPSWAVMVDYGIIQIQSPIRPIVFAHGWTGNTDTFDTIENWLPAEGIQSGGQADLQDGLYPIRKTSSDLAKHINKAILEYGVKKVNVFAHSKGGLVARRSVYDDVVPNLVENLVTFDSPHHGTIWANDYFFLQVYCGQKFKNDPVKAVLCSTSAYELNIQNVREVFNYKNCREIRWGVWINCSPIYVRQPGVNYFSLAADFSEVVVPNQSTTFPWKADRKPFPINKNVDGRFDEIHSSILRDEGAFKCAVHLLDNSRYSCPLFNNTQAVTEEYPEDVFFNQQGQLEASGLVSYTTFVDPSSILLFEVYSVGEIDFHLITPASQIITPEIAEMDPTIEYSASQDLGIWRHAYSINNPQAGDWQSNLSSSIPQAYMLRGLTNGNIKLNIYPEQNSYLTNSLATLHAVVYDGAMIVHGAVVTGEVALPNDNFIEIEFTDQGDNGDLTAGDGIYTSQFTTPGTQVKLPVSVFAKTGQTQREQYLSIPVTNQTASINGVVAETVTDNDWDGLIDGIVIDININVQVEGKFSILATLADSAGNPVEYAQGSTPDTETWLPGSHIIRLVFDGQTIRENLANGPYRVSDVYLSETTDQSFDVDFAQNLYTTTAFSVDQFEAPDIVFLSGSEETLDSDENGLIDQLIIRLTVQVNKPDDYTVNGQLVDQESNDLSWGTGVFSATAAGVYNVDLNFEGDSIGKKGVDGPYTVTNIAILGQVFGSTITYDDLWVTQPYKFTQFEEGFYNVFNPIINGNKCLENCYTIRGNVTNALAPVFDEKIVLRFYTGSKWLTLKITNTNSNGEYQFSNLSRLTSGQAYDIVWDNPNYDDTLLSYYSCNSINNLTPGVYECNFDIMGINLLSPVNNAVVTLPTTFTWTDRPITTDSYEFDIFDYYDGDPWFWTSLLGKQNTYTINQLPDGFLFDEIYTWFVYVVHENGYGYSYNYNDLVFSATNKPYLIRETERNETIFKEWLNSLPPGATVGNHKSIRQ